MRQSLSLTIKIYFIKVKILLQLNIKFIKIDRILVLRYLLLNVPAKRYALSTEWSMYKIRTVQPRPVHCHFNAQNTKDSVIFCSVFNECRKV